jgi:hypothetical protein
MTSGSGDKDPYLSFLEQANQDPAAGTSVNAANTSSTDPKTGFVATKTMERDAEKTVPASLQGVEAYYISETDEMFQPVVLKWEGAEKGVWPDVGSSNHTSRPNYFFYICIWMLTSVS